MLEETAAALARPGRGLLASDESTGTIGKRLEKAGLQNDEVSNMPSLRQDRPQDFAPPVPVGPSLVTLVDR